MAENLEVNYTSKFYQSYQDILTIKQNAKVFFEKQSSEDFIKSLK